MNIVQILPELNSGGVETGVVDIASRLVRLGHKCAVISNGGELVKELEACGVKHYRLPVHRKSPFTILRMILPVCKILREEKADILHARSRVPAIIGYYAARRCGIAFITTCHGYYSKRLFSFSFVMGWGKFVIAISQVIARHMMDNFKVPYRRIRLVCRGVDLEKFKFNPPPQEIKGDFVIGMIGRISPIKGHTYFLRAVSKVVRLLPRLKVLIVGDAPSDKVKYRKELEDMVLKLGLERNVEFLGRRNDVPKILSGMDLMVMATTAQEGFGRVIIEAFASGVPVVATSVGGVTEIVRDGENGLLVPPEDAQSMSEAIVKLLKDRPLSARLAERARKDIEEKFTLDKMVEDTVEVYKEAVSVQRILIIKIAAVGDCVLAVPSIRAIRRKSPRAFIALLIGRQAAMALKGCPYVDEMIVYDSVRRDKGVFRFFDLSAEIKRYGFEEVIDLQNNSRSHLFSFLSSAPQRFGYRKGKYWFLLNRTVKDTKRPVPPVEHQFRVLAMLGIEDAPQELELWPSADDERTVERLLEEEWVGEKQTLVGINASASSRWATKRWPAENFAALCDMLALEEIRPVIIGSKADIHIGLEISKLTKAKPVNFTGKTSLTQLAALMKRFKCIVTSDTAPMHIAAAMKTPFVALFGPTDPSRHLPPACDCVVIRRDLSCSPCYKSACADIRCMREITVEDVMKAVHNLNQI